MNPQIEKVLEGVKADFQANILDGDKVEDCGKAMLSVESVWEYISENMLPFVLEKTREETIEEIKEKLQNHAICTNCMKDINIGKGEVNISDWCRKCWDNE